MNHGQGDADSECAQRDKNGPVTTTTTGGCIRICDVVAVCVCIPFVLAVRAIGSHGWGRGEYIRWHSLDRIRQVWSDQ
jgi:hypothetical protein